MPTPLHWYRLNEQSGTTAADSLGSAPGVYVGTPTLGQAASPSTDPDVLSVLLNGTDAYVDLLSSSNASGLSSTMDAGTLMVWFRPPADNTNPAHETTTDQDGVVLYITDGTAFLQVLYEYKDADPNAIGGATPEVKRLQLAATADGVNGDVLYHDFDTTDNDNDWYHLAVTWGSGAATFFIYGPIDATSPTTQVINAPSAYTWPSSAVSALLAGQSVNLSSNQYLIGYLVDVKLYDSALEQADIESERDRRDYSTPALTVSVSETAEGLARAVQGAAGSYQQITWTKSGAALDLTGAVLSGVIRPQFAPARTITGTLPIDDDPTTGRFIWQYSAVDVEHAGTFQVQFIATFEAHIEMTFMTEWTVERAL
jgi:hypothetical protein